MIWDRFPKGARGVDTRGAAGTAPTVCGPSPRVAGGHRAPLVCAPGDGRADVCGKRRSLHALSGALLSPACLTGWRSVWFLATPNPDWALQWTGCVGMRRGALVMTWNPQGPALCPRKSFRRPPATSPGTHCACCLGLLGPSP